MFLSFYPHAEGLISILFHHVHRNLEQLQTIFTLAAVHWWFMTIPIWTYIDMDLNCRHQPQKCQYFSASNHQIFWSTQLCASKIDGFTHRFVPRHEPTTHVYINYWWTIYTILFNYIPTVLSHTAIGKIYDIPHCSRLQNTPVLFVKQQLWLVQSRCLLPAWHLLAG